MANITDSANKSYIVEVPENPLAWEQVYKIIVNNPIEHLIPKQTVVITQAPAQGYFTFNSNSLIFNWSKGETQSLILNTNSKWFASNNALNLFNYKSKGGPSGNFPVNDLEETLYYTSLKDNGLLDSEWDNYTTTISYYGSTFDSSNITITQLVKPKSKIIEVTDPNTFLSDLANNSSTYSFKVKTTREFNISIPDGVDWVKGENNQDFNSLFQNCDATYSQEKVIKFKVLQNTQETCRSVTFTLEGVNSDDNILNVITFTQGNSGYFTLNSITGSNATIDLENLIITTNYLGVTDSNPLKINFDCNTDWKLSVSDNSWLYIPSPYTTTGKGDYICQVNPNTQFETAICIKEFEDSVTKSDESLVTRTGSCIFSRTWEDSSITLKTITIKQLPFPIFELFISGGFPDSFDKNGGVSQVEVRASDYITWTVSSSPNSIDTMEATLELI